MPTATKCSPSPSFSRTLFALEYQRQLACMLASSMQCTDALLSPPPPLSGMRKEYSLYYAMNASLTCICVHNGMLQLKTRNPLKPNLILYTPKRKP